MNPDVASRTVSVAWIRHVVGSGLNRNPITLAAKITSATVALQADSKNHGALQEAGIHRTMRGMAYRTPIHPRRGMFKQKRAAFVRVALQTWLFVLKPGVHHMGSPRHLPRGRVDAVGIVTVGTVHEPLVYPVLERLRKLRAHIAVTAVADFNLPLRQQLLWGLRPVNRMA